jgi:DNA primase large subunit
MARKPRPRPKARAPLGRTLSPGARKILEDFIADILFKMMNGMIKADQVEPKVAKIREAAMKLTKEEMERIAAEAAEYYVEHANPSPQELSKEEVDNLKREALEFALKTSGK